MSQNIENLKKETKAWVEQHNARKRAVKWQFKTEDARIKLKKIYPQF